MQPDDGARALRTVPKTRHLIFSPCWQTMKPAWLENLPDPEKKCTRRHAPPAANSTDALLCARQVPVGTCSTFWSTRSQVMSLDYSLVFAFVESLLTACPDQ